MEFLAGIGQVGKIPGTQVLIIRAGKCGVLWIGFAPLNSLCFGRKMTASTLARRLGKRENEGAGVDRLRETFFRDTSAAFTQLVKDTSPEAIA